ncbi:MAG TPA: hypothetical protein VF163_14245, partial [Micromonosporaceae bacterium]
RWATAESLTQLRALVPTRGRGALAEVTEPADLWRAEARWWARVRADAMRMLARSGFGPDRIVAAAALLAVDAWLVRAALELAAHAASFTGEAPLDVLDIFDTVGAGHAVA